MEKIRISSTITADQLKRIFRCAVIYINSNHGLEHPHILRDRVMSLLQDMRVESIDDFGEVTFEFYTDKT